MHLYGWHCNKLTPLAAGSMEIARSHVKVLNTARELDWLRRWRADCPWGLLVYRQVFDDGAVGEQDWRRRCEILAREADPLLLLDATVETPWNEQMQTGDALRTYTQLTLQAAEWLHGRGFQVAVGHFSVTWPRDEERSVFLPAVLAADYYSQHTYSAPTVESEWEGNVGHDLETCQWYWDHARRLSLLTEFGIDRGVLGKAQQGWRHQGISPEAYAWQLRQVATRFPSCVRAAFLYCCGCYAPEEVGPGGISWWSFDVAGTPSIEQLVKNVSTEGFAMALKDQYPAEFAQWERAGGVEDNFRRFLLGQGKLPVALADIEFLNGQINAAVQEQKLALGRLPK